jgi:hypothetical protein
VNSRSTIVPPDAFTAFSNWSARPWPYAVRSSTIAIFFMPRFFTANAPATEPCCVSDVIIRKVVLKPCCVYSGAVAMEICGIPAFA